MIFIVFINLIVVDNPTIFFNCIYNNKITGFVSFRGLATRVVRKYYTNNRLHEFLKVEILRREFEILFPFYFYNIVNIGCVFFRKMFLMHFKHTCILRSQSYA